MPSDKSKVHRRCFSDVQSVLDGHPLRHSHEDSAAKIMEFFDWRSGVDVFIDNRGIAIQYFGRSRRWPNIYPVAFAADCVAELMRRAGLNRVQNPTLAILDSSRAKIRLEKTRPLESKVIWLFPANDHLEFFIRPLESRTPPQTGPVPEHGPWKRPDASPAWQPPKPKHLVFEPALACPQCEQLANRYRELSPDVSVCLSCHRSFELPLSTGRG